MNVPLEFVGSMRDPIWGDIPYTHVEKELIGTSAFNRLRHIKQMSMAYIGHIGAQHTRYEHSLGCMHVASNMASSLDYISQESEEILKKKHSIDKPDSGQLQLLRIAALLHDIGHAPLSHLLESAIEKYPVILDECKNSSACTQMGDIGGGKRVIDSYCHEMFSVYTIFTDNEIKKILKDHSISVHDLYYLIIGESFLKNELPSVKTQIIKPIISGDLDADRLDYINRDLYFCGIKQTIDLKYFSDALHLGFSGKKGSETPCILIDRSAVIQASHFLFSRFLLEQSIHHEKTARINEQIFIELVRDYLLNLEPEERLKGIFRLHTKAIDSDLTYALDEFTKKTKPHSMAEKYKKYGIKPRVDVSPFVLTSGKAQERLIEFYHSGWEDYHPLWRYYLYYINKRKNLLVSIERSIGTAISSKDFVLDLLVSKPSKLDLQVNNDGEVRPLLAEFYITIPHSLMVTSFQSSSMTLFANEGTKVTIVNKEELLHSLKDRHLFKPGTETELTEKQLLHLHILKVIEDNVISSISDPIPEELIVLMVMYHLKQFVREKMGHHAATWIKSDKAFQRYLKNHFFDVLKHFFTEDEDKKIEGPNPGIYRICELLSCWGFIDHVHKPIDIPIGSDFSTMKHSNRIDRAISQWGETLIELLCEKSERFSQKNNEIKSIVYESQNVALAELEKLKEFQLKQKKNDEYYEDTHVIENEIKKKQACVIKFV